MDGGSALNILYKDAFTAMKLTEADLRPSHAPFHGVIPGGYATPLGQIMLPVTFGDRNNF